MLKEKHTEQERRVLDVFDRHLAAFTSGNIEAVLADYGDDSVVVTPDGVFVGRDQIRLVFGALISEFGNIQAGESPGFTFEVQHVHKDTIFITWHAETRNSFIPYGTDTIICDGEKILRQSIFFSPLQPRQAA